MGVGAANTLNPDRWTNRDVVTSLATSQGIETIPVLNSLKPEFTLFYQNGRGGPVSPQLPSAVISTVDHPLGSSSLFHPGDNTRGTKRGGARVGIAHNLLGKSIDLGESLQHDLFFMFYFAQYYVFYLYLLNVVFHFIFRSILLRFTQHFIAFYVAFYFISTQI